MPAFTGERDLSGKTSSAVARLLSPDEIVGIFSDGFSSVVFGVVAFWTGMSSTEIVEAYLSQCNQMLLPGFQVGMMCQNQ